MLITGFEAVSKTGGRTVCYIKLHSNGTSIAQMCESIEKAYGRKLKRVSTEHGDIYPAMDDVEGVSNV